MKKETEKKGKFSLEKFEVVRLSNMKSIKGGDGDDGNTSTQNTGTGGNSTKTCRSGTIITKDLN